MPEEGEPDERVELRGAVQEAISTYGSMFIAPRMRQYVGRCALCSSFSSLSLRSSMILTTNTGLEEQSTTVETKSYKKYPVLPYESIQVTFCCYALLCVIALDLDWRPIGSVYCNTQSDDVVT